MNAKEAREIVDKVAALDVNIGNELTPGKSREFNFASGYLAALEGEEVISLIDTASLIHELLCRDVRVGGSLIQELGRRLAAFKQATGKGEKGDK